MVDVSRDRVEIDCGSNVLCLEIDQSGISAIKLYTKGHEKHGFYLGWYQVGKVIAALQLLKMDNS